MEQGDKGYRLKMTVTLQVQIYYPLNTHSKNYYLEFHHSLRNCHQRRPCERT